VTMRASSGGEDFEQPKVRINPTRINGTNQIFFCIADTPMRAFLSFERQGHGFLQGIFGGTRLVAATRSRLPVRPSGGADIAALPRWWLAIVLGGIPRAPALADRCAARARRGQHDKDGRNPARLQILIARLGAIL